MKGRCPVQSSRRNNSVIVIYVYDPYGILAEPPKNRYAGEIVKTWKVLNGKLAQAGVCPLIYTLYNKISKEFKQAFYNKKTPVSTTSYPQSEYYRTSNINL